MQSIFCLPSLKNNLNCNWYFLSIWNWYRQRTHSDRIRRFGVEFCYFFCHVLFWYQEILNLNSTVFFFHWNWVSKYYCRVILNPIGFQNTIEEREKGSIYFETMKPPWTLKYLYLLFSILTEDVFKIF